MKHNAVIALSIIIVFPGLNLATSDADVAAIYCSDTIWQLSLALKALHSSKASTLGILNFVAELFQYLFSKCQSAIVGYVFPNPKFLAKLNQVPPCA